MTGPSSPTVICRQCGTVNNAEDQFCGNCGAFLEWTAEPAEAVDVASAAAPAAPSPVEAAAPGSATPTSAAPAAGAAELVRCPSCGTANVAGRTFCQRCGNKLAGATAAVRMPLPPRTAPGPTAGPTPGPAVATGRQPVAGRTAAARRREAADTGGGLPGWLMVVVAGIVVGAIAVGLVLVLGAGSGRPPTAASSAPSASAAASAAPSASHKASAPTKTPKPTAKPKPSK